MAFIISFVIKVNGKNLSREEKVNASNTKEAQLKLINRYAEKGIEIKVEGVEEETIKKSLDIRNLIKDLEFMERNKRKLSPSYVYFLTEVYIDFIKLSKVNSMDIKTKRSCLYRLKSLNKEASEYLYL